MSEAAIRAYAAEKSFRPQTIERWLSWEEPDRAALVEIAVNLKIGENHLRDVMDWLEEVALRDRLSIRDVLAGKAIKDILTHPGLGRADKLRRIKDQLRRMRFPRLAETEDTIQNKIRQLKLHPEIRLSVPAGLEGGRLVVEFTAASQEELQRAVKKLSAAAENETTSEIFQSLSGAPLEKSEK
jgi:hypothetical protein